MRVELAGSNCMVYQNGAKRIYSESAFWYGVKKDLQAQGYDVIKKLMWKDGHLVDDYGYYVRTRNWGSSKDKPGEDFALIDGYSSIRAIYSELNSAGEVALTVHR